MSHKIISLTASNFKKLTAVEIRPDGNVVTLTGPNGAGKSSILDAIQSALAGGKSIPAEPIRRGEETGQIDLDLGNLKITRRFTAGGSTLRIVDADGRQSRTPQAILDEFIGNLAFDPLAFSRLRAAEQWEQLRELVGLDFTGVDAERTQAYDDRTVINREILRLQTLLKEIPPSVDDAPDVETSTAEVLDEITKAIASNSEIDNADEINNRLKSDVDKAALAIAEAERGIAQWQKELKIRQEAWAVATNAFHTKSVADRPRANVDGLKNRLAGIEQLNAMTRQKQNRNAMLLSAKTEGDKSEQLTTRLAELDNEKKQRIANTRFPLSELSFNGEVITYRGIAFSQVSDGEKLRVSVAVGMALNPKLRVIFVRDGSLLDKSGLQTIADLAAANDYQVWLEDARSTDPSAIEIEDGAIKP